MRSIEFNERISQDALHIKNAVKNQVVTSLNLTFLFQCNIQPWLIWIMVNKHKNVETIKTKYKVGNSRLFFNKDANIL